MIKRPFTFGLIWTFVLLNLLDLATTVYAYFKLPSFNEMNPLYLIFGESVLVLILFKFFFN